MITAKDLAGALRKCPGKYDKIGDVFVDGLCAPDFCIDGWCNLERAARLLNRLERMRGKHCRRKCPDCGELLTVRSGRFVVHHGPGQDTLYCPGSGRSIRFDGPRMLKNGNPSPWR